MLGAHQELSFLMLTLLRCREPAAKGFGQSLASLPRQRAPAMLVTGFPWQGSWGLAWSKFRRKPCKNSEQHLSGHLVVFIVECY